jgi:uncharacterized membrane protein
MEWRRGVDVTLDVLGWTLEAVFALVVTAIFGFWLAVVCYVFWSIIWEAIR